MVDIAMLTGIKCYVNGVLIPVKNMTDYAGLHNLKTTSDDVLYIKNKNADVLLVPSSEPDIVSFASGVYTRDNGTHVDAWVEALLRPMVAKLNGASKTKTNSYTMADVKVFKIFVSVKVINPEFASQSKHCLESPVIARVKKTTAAKLLKWSVMDDIKQRKDMGAIRKIERKSRTRIKVEGHDPANKSGGKTGRDCTLCVVEGLSAKTYVVQGLDVGVDGKTGRDWFGIYALRGKLLNVRCCAMSTVASNKIICDILRAVGFRSNVDYTVDENFYTLQYGSIMIITDADVDGMHIQSLLMNVIHKLFPTVLQRKKSFLRAMQTQIARVGGKKPQIFYDEREYKKYAADFSKRFPTKKLDAVYFKGLGSNSAADIAETFGKKMVDYYVDDDTERTMNKCFHKKMSDPRKKWIASYNPHDVALSWKGSGSERIRVSISRYLDTELIKYSIADCARSLPHLMDGLKESHRKTIYSCFLRKLAYTGKTLKVAQLAGYVAEHSAYRHGENNLYDTITKMGSGYVGSNNIPLLFRGGQFGSRLSGGKDAANARYIFTKLDAMTRYLFDVRDDDLLDRVEDDGQVVEPKYYCPILPTVLINGCRTAIGTGWSSTIPAYNPLDIVKVVRQWIDEGTFFEEDDNGNVISSMEELTPWYRGFTGVIEKVNDTKWTSWGTMHEGARGIKVVTELPVGMWTDNFQSAMEDLRTDKRIKKVDTYSSDTKVDVRITESTMTCDLDSLKLHTNINTSNMVMFTPEGHIRQYSGIDTIVEHFCEVRLELYVKRRTSQKNTLEEHIKYQGNKRRFLQAVMDGDLLLFVVNVGDKGRKARSKSDMIIDLDKQGYDRKTSDEDEQITNHGFDYILSMNFMSITLERIDSLTKDIDSKKKELSLLLKTTAEDMWISDIDRFEAAYIAWLPVINAETKKSRDKKKTGSNK